MVITTWMFHNFDELTKMLPFWGANNHLSHLLKLKVLINVRYNKINYYV